MKQIDLLLAAAILATVPATAIAASGFLGGADQKAALLSPVPLGPATPLEGAPIEASVAAPVAAPVAERVDAPAPKAQTTSKPRRAKAAPRRPRTNPLDSFARDTRPQKPQTKERTPRRQTWPCTGGGICAWTTPR